MSGESFIFNDPPGAFIVKSPDGGVAFDSRMATQRLYMTGTADVAGPPNTGYYAIYLEVPYGKVFPKPPYVRSAARALDGSDVIFQYFYPPYLTWMNVTVTGVHNFSGNYTNAGVSSLSLGNAMQNRRVRHVYAVFENQVG